MSSVPSAVELIRQRPDMYFPHGVTPDAICLCLADDALAMGAAHVRVDNVDQWRIVSSDMDWLRVRNSRDVGPRFHGMSVHDFTACRSSVSWHVGPVREVGQPQRATVVSFSIGKEIAVAQARLSVRKIREILRLRAEGFSERDIAGSVGVARSSIQICLWRAERAGVGWPPPADQDDAALEALLYPRPKPGVEVHPHAGF